MLVNYSACPPSTVQYSTVQYSTVQYSTVQYSTVQYLDIPESIPQEVEAVEAGVGLLGEIESVETVQHLLVCQGVPALQLAHLVVRCFACIL